MKKAFRSFIGAVACAFFLPAMTPAYAEYPDRPITVVAPFAAGSATDIWARAISKGLQEILGKPVVVENRTGASGQIGTNYAARATPDGYTLVIGTPANAIGISLYDKLPYDFQRDFAPIAHMATYPLVLVAGPEIGKGGLPDIIEQARKDPGSVSYGSSGNGSSAHLAGEMLGMLTKAQFTHVPYRGTSAVYPDLMGGTTDLLFDNVVVAGPQVKAGAVHAILIANPTRSKVIPDVPTSKELGLPELLASSWVTVYAPAGTPEPIIARLNDAINQVLKQPAFREQYESQGAEIVGGTPEQLRTFFSGEVERWGKVINFADIKLD